MKKFKNQTLSNYSVELAGKNPVPGGGSAAALTAALGAALIAKMAAYSLKKERPKMVKQKIKRIERDAQKIRRRLIECVDLDAQAYLKVVKSWKGPAKQKKAALKAAGKVPLEISRLTYSAIQLTPYLVKHGNQNFLSDVQAAGELLLASFTSAMIMVEANR